jgi:hypothetical protein
MCGLEYFFIIFNKKSSKILTFLITKPHVIEPNTVTLRQKFFSKVNDNILELVKTTTILVFF